MRVIFLTCYSVENIEQQSTSQNSAIDFFLLFFLLKINWFQIAHKRKIYDNRSSNKSSYRSYSHHHNHHHHRDQDYDYTPSSHRRGNRYGGFTFRGLFEPTSFYKFFGINIRVLSKFVRFYSFEKVLNVHTDIVIPIFDRQIAIWTHCVEIENLIKSNFTYWQFEVC